MTTVLVTAFEPYDRWSENASWLALVELTRNLPAAPKLVTRRYPVDFMKARERLEKDLGGDYDFAIHLGQAPGSSMIRLESIALNVGGTSHDNHDALKPLVADGPIAYRTRLPLASWADQIRAAGIPVQVSYHAGTYLCNAVFYLSSHLTQRRGLRTQSVFIHLPLEVAQAVREPRETASLPAAVSAEALRIVLRDLAART
ncbi:MAG: pyroglutamyl-peptidase I [Pirellulales bacterium]